MKRINKLPDSQRSKGTLLGVFREHLESALASAFAPAHGFGVGKNRRKNRKIPQDRTAGPVSMLLRQDA
jgi:hypothetical protein